MPRLSKQLVEMLSVGPNSIWISSYASSSSLSLAEHARLNLVAPQLKRIYLHNIDPIKYAELAPFLKDYPYVAIGLQGVQPKVVKAICEYLPVSLKQIGICTLAIDAVDAVYNAAVHAMAKGQFIRIVYSQTTAQKIKFYIDEHNKKVLQHEIEESAKTQSVITASTTQITSNLKRKRVKRQAGVALGPMTTMATEMDQADINKLKIDFFNKLLTDNGIDSTGMDSAGFIIQQATRIKMLELELLHSQQMVKLLESQFQAAFRNNESLTETFNKATQKNSELSIKLASGIMKGEVSAELSGIDSSWPKVESVSVFPTSSASSGFIEARDPLSSASFSVVEGTFSPSLTYVSSSSMFSSVRPLSTVASSIAADEFDEEKFDDRKFNAVSFY